MSSLRDRKRKRPKTAYNFFFAEEHERIREDLEAKADRRELDESAEAKAEGRDPPKKKRRKKISPREELGFEQLGKLIGGRWKALTDEEKERYKKMAKEDAARHKEEFERNYQEKVSSLLGTNNEPSTGTGVESSVSASSSLNTDGLLSTVGASSSSSEAASAFNNGYPLAQFDPGTAAAELYSNPSMGLYGTAAAASGAALMPQSLRSGYLLSTPEQQQLLLQSYLSSMYPSFNGLIGTAALPGSNATGIMAPPSGVEGAPLLPGAVNYPLLPPQLQPPPPTLPMTEHQQMLARAERTRALLIQQGARVSTGPWTVTEQAHQASSEPDPDTKPSHSVKNANDRVSGESDEDSKDL
mmetsp:Transcript_13503/g.29336  ORF Transcript_13503/g.29336 Transcript_13503/m.29336 type:complete len:356 (+) Transcript_13503:333-1400(+)